MLSSPSAASSRAQRLLLADSARTVLTTGRASQCPYAAAGLIIILLFWVRSLIHTLTLMRWPLELGHNCLYIACALLEVLAFTRLSIPFMWSVLLAFSAAAVWLVFVYDLKMVRLRLADCSSPNSCRLYEEVLRDQWRNIRFIIPDHFLPSTLSPPSAFALTPVFLSNAMVT